MNLFGLQTIPANDDTAQPLVGQPFLEALTIDYGPLQLLGRFFAAADSFLRANDLRLRLGSMDDVFAIHERNQDSWHSYPPMLNSSIADVDAADTFGIICQTPAGDAVAAIAGRIYRTPANLGECVENQSFLYGAAAPPADGPRFENWARQITAVASPFSYIGALWVHPQYRGLKLARILPPLTRGYALAKWNIKYDVGLANETMAKAGIAEVYGYTNVESGFRAVGLPDDETYTGTFLWMNAEEIAEHMRTVLLDRLSKVDAGIVDGTADKYA